MQRITIKDENGAILAVLHAMNCTVKETNGVSIDIDGGLRTINTPHSHPIKYKDEVIGHAPNPEPALKDWADKIYPPTGPEGRQTITTHQHEHFITPDGYELRPEGSTWTDGDFSFATDREGHPIDIDGHRLEGHYEEYCTKCEELGHQAINCHYTRDI